MYRLYTVVPRLVRFIDQLTNWYVRFNRKRIKVLLIKTNSSFEGLVSNSPQLTILLVELSNETRPYINIQIGN